MNRYPTIAVVLLAVLWWAVSPMTIGAAEAQPPGGDPTPAADEAFATYLNWAAEDLREGDGFKLSFGPKKMPVGYGSLAGSATFFETIDALQPGDSSAFEPSTDDAIYGIGLTLSLPAGLSYTLHYGSVDGTNNPALFKRLERDLAFRINRNGVAQAYGGSFRWRTPLDGFTLKGTVSQMQLSANAAPMPAPGWMTTGTPLSSRGSLYSSTRTWRAGAEQTIGSLKLSAEYVQNQIDTRFNDDTRAQQIGEGYTGRAAYQVNRWFRIASSYSLYFADRDDRDGEALSVLGQDPAGAWIQDIGISARFDLSNRMALQLEGHLMNGLLGVAEGTDEDWRRFGARMTIKF